MFEMLAVPMDTAAHCEQIAHLACDSLTAEARLYPKPGLVSPVDAGSHRDMDFPLFLRSIDSLRDYFVGITRAGHVGADFARLRQLGQAAEAVMLQATHGVNTHRGAIFNLGLLCAAAGQLQAQRHSLTAAALTQTVRQRWGAAILASGQEVPDTPLSHGQQVARQYGSGGARQQAAAGFPAVMQHGLLAYRSALAQTQSPDAAAVQALFALMAHLDDSNILWRAGPDGLQFVRQTAATFLRAGGVLASDWQRRAVAIHRAFVRRNLSPGGAADLLGVTLFIAALDAAG